MFQPENKEEIDNKLRQLLAIYCTEHPKLLGRLNGYFGSNPDTIMAMGRIISKLYKLDMFIETLFAKELDIKEGKKISL